MSTDIATIDNIDATLPMGTDAMVRLGQWVDAAAQAHKLVRPLVDSAFVPDNFKPRIDPRASDEEKAHARDVAVANATSAVLLGLNLGLDPLTALQQIILIKNRPGMYAKAKVGILTARGYDIWTETLTDERAVVCVVRPGSDRVERFEVTMDMARNAGWTSNDNYAKTPHDMLYARAAGRACDRTGAHILLGIPTAEDIPDVIHVQADAGRPITRADLLDAEPVTDDAPPAAPEPERVTPKASSGQQRTMGARFKRLGIDDRDDRLTRVSLVIGRDVDSADELTATEADAVIVSLDREINTLNTPKVSEGGWPETAQPPADPS